MPPQSAPIARHAAVAQATLNDLQLLLSLLVRQTISANGWTVSSLSSQLNPSVVTSVQEQSGMGQWHVDFKIYQETIDLYNPATGELKSPTEGGNERAPEWLNASTLLYTAPAAADQPDAVWQIKLDGSGAAVLAGSGQPGVSEKWHFSGRWFWLIDVLDAYSRYMVHY